MNMDVLFGTLSTIGHDLQTYVNHHQESSLGCQGLFAGMFYAYGIYLHSGAAEMR